MLTTNSKYQGIIPRAPWRLACFLICLATFPVAAAAPDAAEPSVAYSNPEEDKAAYNPESDGTSSKSSNDGNRDGVQCDGTQVCREISTRLPMQVLPRSFSNVYRTQNTAADNIVVANIQPFRPLYVFKMEAVDLSITDAPLGWYQVANLVTGPALGWMQARDVLEWRQALVVAYTHPGTVGEGRQRVLMFKEKKDILALLDTDDPVGEAVAIYRSLEAGDIRSGLISKEPERFVDISRDFYLLPIINHEQIDWEGDEMRILQLASALPGKRGADTLTDPAYLKESMISPKEVVDEKARTLGIDLVFVMDMTLSMQPYIDRTRDAIAAIANRTSKAAMGEKIHYGLVGFRDDVSLTPELEFTSKNFTPQLVDIKTFEELLQKQARASEKSSVGYAEEVFAGIDTALASAWNANSLRFLVFVSDASSHPLGHAQNTTGKDSQTLQMEADDAQVHIIAVHLLNPKHPEDHDVAGQQFAILSSVRGSQDEVAMVQLDTEDVAGFQEAVEVIASDIIETVALAQEGTLDDRPNQDPAPIDPASRPADPARHARKAVRAVINAAMMEYLGRDVDAPKDIVAWTVDRDLTNPAITSLDVRVLLNKSQLNDLIMVLDHVIVAMDKASISNRQFFTALQEVAGQTMKNPAAMASASTLSGSGLLPAYIAALPYHSEILQLNDAMFASMTAEARSKLDSKLRAKLKAYRDISSDVDGWKTLYAGDSDLDKVYPLRLEYLP